MIKKRCHYCGRLFIPDKRVGNRQKACSKQCQGLRKKEDNKVFSRNNPGYWQGRYDEYVRQWGERNPDYQKHWRQRKKQSEIHQGEKEQFFSEIQAKILKETIDGY